MPYINGKYYINPQYGTGLERARQRGRNVFDAIVKSLETGSARPILEAILRGSESSDQPVVPRGVRPTPRSGLVPVSEFQADQQDGNAQGSTQGQAHSHAHNSANGHWVTIDHRHVFIQESEGSGREWHSQANGKVLPSSGQASIYSDIFEGEKTSNGEIFHQKGYTAALLPRTRWHALPLGTRVELTHGGNKVVVEINDRGAGDREPHSTRALDLSRAAASVLIGHEISGDKDAKSVGLIHLDQIKVVPKDTPLGPVRH